MEHELDARRLLCPMPVIRTQDRIKTLQPGDVLTVTATDPGALSDIPTWCRINGHSVTESWQDGAEVHIRIVVGDA
ncbi:MAG: sulfurtransferase TusA family protein [Gammaproteobacteria bacterium]|nr:sulfurtransferase TusA family protein [Gammaproteobacteria bacterium]